MLDITKLKDGDRVKFADNTFACVTNYETDISNQCGTVVNFSKNDWDNPNTVSHVWIKLDIPNEHFDCDEWGNAVQFNLTDEMDGGTSVDYLKKAKLIGGNV
jgi:hypothetical protein